MIVPLLLVVGVVLGVVVGRWWALAAPIGFGLWVAIVSDVDVPGWYLGAWYGGVGCVGLSAGVLARRAIRRLCDGA